MHRRLPYVLLIFLVGFAIPARAALHLAHVFQDHMVFQRDKPLPVWGWAKAGAMVKVGFAGQEHSVRADDQGYWKVVLAPCAASAEGRSLKVSDGSESLALKDVLVGEVWLCAGQSNMARTLKNDAVNYPWFTDYAKEAEYPSIRFIRYATHAADSPMADFDALVHREDRWQVLGKASALDSMSIPLFFAKDLYEKLGVPIGLVQVAVPGTPQTSWLARETLDATNARLKSSVSYDTVFTKAQEILGKGTESYKDWAGFVAAETAWRANPTPRWPGSNGSIPDFPCVLYNALVHPLAPMALQGVLWHQGEGGPAVNYRERLVAQVSQWRKLFGQDFYFIWGSMTRNTTTPPPTAAEAVSFRGNIDEEFLLASQDFGVDGKAVLVNFFDLGNPSTHWARKDEGAHRMAKAALASAYGKPDTVFTGPEMTDAKIEEATIRVKFRHVGGGLVYEPSVDGISGFLIQEKGADPELRWAHVAIEGDTVVLSHPEVKKPVNAYYGWHANPHETLFNREGFPAYGFRAIPRSAPVKGAAGAALVELLSPGPRITLNVSHVRRNGYIFNVTQDRNSGTATVRVRLPREWTGATFTAKGRPVEPGRESTDADGYRLYEFTVEINGPDVIVGNTAQPPDFSAIKRP